MTSITRRQLGSIFGAGAAGMTMAPLSALFANKAQAQRRERRTGPGFGELGARYPLNMSELPASLQNIAFLELPPDFEYTVMSVTGDTMSDGQLVPGGHDGMAAFRGPRGTTLLVRNHELGTSGTPVIVPGATYDAAVRGGTTNLVVAANGKLLKHYGSLAGTERNCAGGPTPWNSWLTCEEAFSVRDGKRHGYVFDVPADGIGNPEPLWNLGRFNHEAAAVDPDDSYVYMTEDRGDSLFYRYRPSAYGDLRSPGQLEALRYLDWPDGINTAKGFLDELHVPHAAEWVPIDNYDPETDTVRVEGREKGAALFTRGEGCWYANGFVYFVCSNGGDLGKGQVFAYDTVASTLTMVVESTDARLLEAPDNITVGPDGRLYLCEDGTAGDNIVGVEHEGDLFLVAHNHFNDSEFAGACFSPNGRIMYVNIQSPGLTLAISGPWLKSRR